MPTMEDLRMMLANPNDKLIAVDLDWTLTNGEFWWGVDRSQPNLERIEFVNNLYKNGAHIIIYTARQPEMYWTTLAWLIENGVMFHGISMTKKCGADLYLEDKALNAEEMD